jgi:hypothetical protein
MLMKQIPATFAPTCCRAAGDLHSHILHVLDLFCLCLVKQGNKDLLHVKAADRDRIELDKRRAGAHAAVIGDLVPVLQAQALHKLLVGAQDTGDALCYLPCYHD